MSDKTSNELDRDLTNDELEGIVGGIQTPLGSAALPLSPTGGYTPLQLDPNPGVIFTLSNGGH